MKSNQFWLKLLNVHTNEWGVVRKLFWLQFFQGAGITFFFSAEFSRFLDKFPVYQLPWVMVIASFMLWIAGFIYSKLEHIIPFKTFNIAMIVLMALSMLMVRVGSNYFSGDWFDYVSFAWFYVLYLLNNLEFWGIAAQLFDIRQSKRLFGVVSAGEIPAKFVGYTLAYFIVGFTGTLNLLLIGVFCMICSIPFFLHIAKTEEGAFKNDHGHGHKHVHHAHKNKVGNLVSNYFNNKIIFRIALISLLSTACLFIVNYGFYAKVKEAYHDDVELAKFIAFFMAILRIAALITKILFTGRLATNLGVRKSLFIMPVTMMVMVGIILVSGFTSNNVHILFYQFGALAIAVDVLKISINSPILLAAMQPLPTHERLRAHNIVKGIMDPFATLFCGILLISLFWIQGEINLITLCYFLIIIGIIWLVGVIRVNKVYLNMLVNTISSRFFSQEEFTLNDPQTVQKIKEKINTGTYPEVLSILQMVSTKQNPLSAELLGNFLQHPSGEVRLEAVRLIGSKQINTLKDELNTVLIHDSNEAVKGEAIKTICRLTENTPELLAYLNHPDSVIRQAAITGMLSNNRAANKETAEKELHLLLRSEHPEERDIALKILQEVKDDYDHPDHALLIESNHPETRKKAIDAIGRGALHESLDALTRQLGKQNKQVYKALQNAGEKAIPFIKNVLTIEKTGNSTRHQLIRLCGKIGGSNAHHLLLQLLQVSPAESPVIIKALYRSKFVADKKDIRALLEEFCKAYIRYAVELLHMQKILPKTEIPATLIYNSVQIELLEIRETLLCLFSLLYDREQIRKVRTGLNANQRSSIANAMEIIELTVRKDIGKYFNILYEDVPLDRKCDDLKFLNEDINYQQTNQVLRRILSEQPIAYQDWTKACSMYISKKYHLDIDRRLLDKFLVADNLMLQETAIYARA
ncbi:HEAT repeat domain-containing protein [Flavihumibacter fluvii]|uniref:HEAT repeat domain-containing protein n=1 Tax=Flavihumibacter fluvii TaxID=2838157 RepID=UPI001BDE0BCC|nr:HEAT repeat domain-containing protein [Flavihumibacter fluvii]ULQ50668.1 MFS transporter [Flavihumibacter fluvii]